MKYVNAVLKPNTKILSSKDLRHHYGSDSHDWVVITEDDDKAACLEQFAEKNGKLRRR